MSIPLISAFPVDAHILFNGGSYRVLHRTATAVHLVHEETDDVVGLLAEEVATAFRRGVLTIHGRGGEQPVRERIEQYLRRDMETNSPGQRAACRWRSYYVHAWYRERPGAEASVKAMIARVAAEIADPKPPCTRSLRAWVRLVRAADGDERALLGVASRPSGSGTLPEALLRLMDEVIQQVYLVRERISFSAAVRILDDRIAQHNERTGPTDQLPTAHRTTVLRYLKASYHPYDIRAARYGRADADRWWTAKALGARAARILDRVQIDSTLVDTIVVAPGKEKIILGRPWITIAIDVYSRVLLAIVIGFAPPSIETLTQTLRQLCLPKGDIRARHGLSGEGYYGKPTEIMVDNALEFHSDALRDFCRREGIVITYHPKGEPWWKGMVERLFRTIQQDLFHTLPGTTFSNVQERGSYNSEEHARLTLDEIRRLAWTWADTYHAREHAELRDTPAAVWAQSDAASSPTLRDVRDADGLLPIVPRGSARTNSDVGISCFGLHYDSEELRYLRPMVGETSLVEARYDPSDIGFLLVYAPGQSRALRVPAVWRDYAEGLSLHQHDYIKAHIQDKHATDDGRRQQYLEAKRRLLAAIEEAYRRRGKRDAARLMNLPSEEAAAARPRQPPAPPPAPDDPLADTRVFDPPTSPDDLGSLVTSQIQVAEPAKPTSRLRKAARRDTAGAAPAQSATPTPTGPNASPDGERAIGEAVLRMADPPLDPGAIFDAMTPPDLSDPADAPNDEEESP